MLADWKATDFVDSAQAVGLPCALMQTPAQFVLGGQQRSRGFFVDSDPGGPGSFEIPGAAFVSSPSITSFRRSAPELGASNRDVYLDQLGHAQSEFDRWRDDGLV
jgi:crotonobetainyl-CoA:carnitine CoA-transferase CaiB-like acyl-CoA transferase